AGSRAWVARKRAFSTHSLRSETSAPPPTRPDDLVAVEREDRQVAEHPRRPPLVRPPERLHRVLDQRDVVLAAGSDNRLVVRALPVEVDHQDRLRQLPHLRPPVEFL